VRKLPHARSHLHGYRQAARSFLQAADPLQSKAAGAPDACTSCHTDKSAEWAAAQITAWFPSSDHSWQDRAPFIAFHNGDSSQATISALVEYALSIEHPDIVRATALDNLRGYADPALVNELRSLFADKSDLVRAAAAHLARKLDGVSRSKILGPLLSDPVRAVRQSAANELTATDSQAMSADERTALEKAIAEYRASELAMADTPESHMALAGAALASRNWQQAEDSFNKAVAMDPQLDSAWLMLARLRSALGDEQGAMAYLDKGLTNLPGSTSLLLAHAVAEAKQGNNEKAIDWYRRVITIDPNQMDALAGLAISALRVGNTGLALDASAKLLTLTPDSAMHS
jgi:tetratricopeptide (TPR) repeat protein